MTAILKKVYAILAINELKTQPRSAEVPNRENYLFRKVSINKMVCS